MRLLVVVVSSMLVASAGLAQSPSGSGSGTDNRPSGQQAGSPAGSPAGGAASRDEEVICRRIQADTGSRISGRQRVCMTRRQWREYERNN